MDAELQVVGLVPAVGVAVGALLLLRVGMLLLLGVLAVTVVAAHLRDRTVGRMRYCI